MTELQLRLWCLWMCEEFADREFGDPILWAIEGADTDMFHMLLMCVNGNPLRAWQLSERMP